MLILLFSIFGVQVVTLDPVASEGLDVAPKRGPTTTGSGHCRERISSPLRPGEIDVWGTPR